MDTPSCLVTDCDDTPRTRGYCNKHYIRLRKFGDPLFTKNYAPDAVCEVEGCETKPAKKNMCKLHYQRMSRTGRTDVKVEKFRGTTEQRFWHYAQKQEDGCWLWTGPTTSNGRPGAKQLVYGILYVSESNEYVRAHRWGYEHYVESIPQRMQIDHVCRNTLCVNYTSRKHLEVVTNRENTMRGEIHALRFDENTIEDHNES